MTVDSSKADHYTDSNGQCKNRVLLGLLCCALLAPSSWAAKSITLPARLQSGDTVALISSSFRVQHAQEIQFATERLQALGLKVVYSDSILDQHGYFAGSDEQRAADINRFFADPEVKAIIQLRGGWGAARLLDKIDYQLIADNPKIFMGFSDATALLLAIYQQTGLITVHGPMAAAYHWTPYTTNYLKQVLFDGDTITFENPPGEDNDLTQTTHRIFTIHPGRATGTLIGGNLTVLTSLLGSPYLPDFKDKILFVEEVGEDVYRIDRMLTQLHTAGVLQQLAGFIFGACIDCTTKIPYGSYRLEEVLTHHIAPLQIPAWSGAMIGHQADVFVLGEGTQVRIDANAGTITMLEPMVQMTEDK